MLKKALKQTFPIFLGYVPMGIAFGVLLQNAGYNPLLSLIIALTIYSGSMQFVMVALLTGNDSLASCALITFLVQSRHLFYGLSLIDRYKKFPLLKRLYLMFALTDETYSLMTSLKEDEDYNEDSLIMWISFLNHTYWMLGCFLGAILGNIIPFRTEGIDFAMTALFVTIVIDQYQNSQNHFPFYLGLIIGILSLILFGPDQFLLIALIVTSSILIIKGAKNI